MSEKNLDEYWQKNLRILAGLLAAWFIVSYGCGIIFADSLNGIRLGGYKLGFWFAQQGSIYAFIAIIYTYIYRMNKLDREYDVHDD